jgi:hypothetical protein
MGLLWRASVSQTEGSVAERGELAHGRMQSVLPQYTPMDPTLVREPFHRDGSVYEEKL